MLKSPVVYEQLNNGGISVQLGTANTFVCIPSDHAVEERAKKTHIQQGARKKMWFTDF